MSLSLNEAINTAQTFKSLRLLAEKLDAGYDLWGRSFLVAKPRPHGGEIRYVGKAPIDALLLQALAIIKQSGHSVHNYPERCPERAETARIDREITRIYFMDKKNEEESSLITKIIVVVKNFFSFICGNHEPHHRDKWWQNDDNNSYFSGFGGHILEPYRQTL